MSRVKVVLHTVFSGIIASFLSLFFAEGALGENYTGKTFVSPVFFLIIILWVLSAATFMSEKHSPKDTVRLMWISIPLGLIIAFPIAAFT